MSEETPTTISITKLREWCDPFEGVCWADILDGPITREEVQEAIDQGRLRGDPADGYSEGEYLSFTRQDHIERVAYFVVHRDPKPIDLDVGIPDMGCYVDWPVQDGNHRFAAAIFRGDETIEAWVMGAEEEAEILLAEVS